MPPVYVSSGLMAIGTCRAGLLTQSSQRNDTGGWSAAKSRLGAGLLGGRVAQPRLFLVAKLATTFPFKTFKLGSF
jgi:hypothetical protein